MEEVEMQKKRRRVLTLPFQIISISFLSLLVPLSFLFLSRLSLFNYHLLTTGFSPTLSSIDLIAVYVLYIIVSSILAATLFHSLAGKTKLSVLSSRLFLCWAVLYIYWTVLFLLQVHLTRIEGSFDKKSFLAAQERWVWIRVMFFLGLHEVMLMWFRTVVKPVVDDTVLGVYTEEERWWERGVVAVTLGTMWWWRLREEAEGLAVVTELKHKLLIGLEDLDVVNWWLYYLSVAIGMVKVLIGFLWVWMALI